MRLPKSSSFPYDTHGFGIKWDMSPGGHSGHLYPGTFSFMWNNYNFFEVWAFIYDTYENQGSGSI